MHEVILNSISERAFQAQIVEVAHLYGWIVYHVPDSRMCTASGFPDLILCHPVKHRLLIREIKTQKGRVRPMQTVWLQGMQASGADTGIWRPEDWDTIVETLAT